MIQRVTIGLFLLNAALYAHTWGVGAATGWLAAAGALYALRRWEMMQ